MRLAFDSQPLRHFAMLMRYCADRLSCFSATPLYITLPRQPLARYSFAATPGYCRWLSALPFSLRHCFMIDIFVAVIFIEIFTPYFIELSTCRDADRWLTASPMPIAFASFDFAFFHFAFQMMLPYEPPFISTYFLYAFDTPMFRQIHLSAYFFLSYIGFSPDRCQALPKSFFSSACFFDFRQTPFSSFLHCRAESIRRDISGFITLAAAFNISLREAFQFHYCRRH
jgi:hypothetical protein